MDLLSSPHGGLTLGGCVGSMGMTIITNHLFRIPMIRGDKENVVILLASLVDDTDGLVSGRDSLDSSIVYTGVTDHVGRSKVAHDKVVLARGHLLGDLKRIQERGERGGRRMSEWLG